MLKQSLVHKAFSLLQYASDLHLERGFQRTFKVTKPYLILGGDIGYPKKSEYKDFLLNCSDSFDKVFVQSGNHEYDQCKNNFQEVDHEIINICMMRPNLFYLQKFEFPLCQKDKLFLIGCTLWSKLPKTKTDIHMNHVEWLRSTLDENPQNNYIISTHHCPAFECLSPYYFNRGTANYFVSDQSRIIEKDNMLAWIYGHSHYNKNLNLHGKWLVTNQYGSHEKPLKGFV